LNRLSRGEKKGPFSGIPPSLGGPLALAEGPKPATENDPLEALFFLGACPSNLGGRAFFSRRSWQLIEGLHKKTPPNLEKKRKCYYLVKSFL